MKFNYNYHKKTIGKLDCIKIPVKIYKCRVVILLPKEAKKLIKDWNFDSEADARTIDYLEEHNEITIMFKELTDGNIVHELLHAVQMIMEWVGHEIKGADEPSAYLLGYLFTEFKKKTKKKQRIKLDLRRKKE